ncbi:WGR domain-containing protein [Planctomicrobium sp. SH668]|uniref:WGR domain-containing protein n=1 Tax=Planctomicrobium sp. SH668 TaxID=3448126 RepID=UPI003F5B7810
MDHLLTVRLEAHYPERNHHRFYELALGLDLFGLWTLTVHHGRTGRPGHQRSFSSSDLQTLQTQIRRCLIVRESAPRRLGCRYQLVNLSQDDDLLIEDWLPEAWLQPFR